MKPVVTGSTRSYCYIECKGCYQRRGAKQLIERGLDVIFYEAICQIKPYEQDSTSSRTKFW